MNKIFEDNLELVDSVIKYYVDTSKIYSSYTDKDDLQQELYISINKYIIKYNKDKGTLKNWIIVLTKYAIGNYIQKLNAKKRSPFLTGKKQTSLYSVIEEDDLRLLDIVSSNIEYNKFDDLDMFEYFPQDTFSKKELKVINSIILSKYNFRCKSDENTRMRVIKKCKDFIKEKKGIFNTNEYISIDNVF